MECHVSFHLLHHLMNVSVQYGHRAEAFQQIEGLRAILGGPAPVRICGPQWNMSKDHDRSAGPQFGHIALEPRHLLVSQRAHAFELRRIVQPNEMDPFVVEALPTPPGGALTVTLHVLLALVSQQVVLSGDEERLLLAHPFKELVQGIELTGLRQVRQIPRMKDEVGLMVQRVDLIHRGLESQVDIRIGCLVEPDVTVADLDESEVLGARLFGLSTQQAGCRYASGEAPHYPRSSPLHAFQEAAPVDVAGEDTRCAFLVVLNISHSKHLSIGGMSAASSQETRCPANYSQ